MKKLVPLLLGFWLCAALPGAGQGTARTPATRQATPVTRQATPAAKPVAVPEPEEEWQKIFFRQPERALPLLVAAAVQVSPSLRTMALEKDIYGEELRLARLSILNSLTAGASYSYGNLASLPLVDPGDPNLFNTYNSSRYTVGGTLSVPFDQLLGRKHIVNRVQLQADRAESVRQERELVLRQQVLQLYQQVLLARRLLAIQDEAVAISQINRQLADKSFQRGQVTLGELTEANAQYTQAASSRETAASQYATAFLTLETVVGVKISSLMTSSK